MPCGGQGQCLQVHPAIILPSSAWYGARVGGTKTYIFNPSLRLVLYQFLHTVSSCRHETIHYTQQTATNTTTMVVEPLAPPATRIWSIHTIQCMVDLAEGLGKGTGQKNTVVTLKFYLYYKRLKGVGVVVGVYRKYIR